MINFSLLFSLYRPLLSSKRKENLVPYIDQEYFEGKVST